MIERIGVHRGMPAIGMAGCALGITLLSLAACGDDTVAPSAPGIPAHVSAAIKDPRIGAGLAPEYRLSGVEHNRLTLVTLRALRAESRGYRDEALRCEGIFRIANEQAPRTAAAAGAPEQGAFLAAAAAAALRGKPGCAPFASRRTAMITADTGIRTIGEDAEPYSDATDAAMESFIAEIGSATSIAEVSVTIAEAASFASTLSGPDAWAFSSLVSQVQGSFVLWQPGGAGWTELGDPGDYQSVFRRRAQMGTIDAMVAVITADAIGCLSAMRASRQSAIQLPPPLVMAACGTGAAVATLYAGYKIVTAHL